MYTARELRHQLKDSGAHAIVVMEMFAHTVAEVVADTQIRQVITTCVGDLLGFPKARSSTSCSNTSRKSCRNTGSTARSASRRAGPWRTGTRRPLSTFVRKTSHSCNTPAAPRASPRGAMLTHRNLVANMQQSSAWIGKKRRPRQGNHHHRAAALSHLRADLELPGVHEFGGLNYLITNPRDMGAFVKELRKSHFTAITGVNTLFNGLLNTPGFAELDFSKVTLSLGGGMAVQRAVADRWKKVTGITLVEAYGLTETSPRLLHEPARPARLQRRDRFADPLDRLRPEG